MIENSLPKQKHLYRFKHVSGSSAYVKRNRSLNMQMLGVGHLLQVITRNFVQCFDDIIDKFETRSGIKN